MITGDTHIPIDGRKILNINDQGMTKKDNLIICGDFGLIWDQGPSPTEKKWISKIQNKNFTTLFIDGNHDNHDRLNDLQTTEIFNNTVGIVSDNIYYLKRGHIYIINNKTFFCMGGAFSIDAWHLEKDLITGKQHKVWDRKPGKTWWEKEQPSKEDMLRAINNLESYNWKIDYVITHTCPLNIANTYLATASNHLHPDEVRYLSNKKSEVEKYFQILSSEIEFEKWFFGHWHYDWSTFDYYKSKKRFYYMLYDDIKIIN